MVGRASALGRHVGRPSFNTSFGAAYLDMCGEDTSRHQRRACRTSTAATPAWPSGAARPAAYTSASSSWTPRRPTTLDKLPLYTGTVPDQGLAATTSTTTARPPRGRGDNYGYSVGVTLGKSGKKQAPGICPTPGKCLGANAWWEELADSGLRRLLRHRQLARRTRGSGARLRFRHERQRPHLSDSAYSPFDSLDAVRRSGS